MSYKTWSFYNNLTNKLIGICYTGREELLLDNTPEGCSAIEGKFDKNLYIIEIIDNLPTAVLTTQSQPTLQDLKKNKRNEMLGYWNLAKEAGVTIGSKTAPTDPDSWTRYLAIKAMSSEGGWIDVPIPLTDGTFELLTQQKAAILWSALKDMERTLLTKLRVKIEAINSAGSKAELDAITWD